MGKNSAYYTGYESFQHIHSRQVATYPQIGSLRLNRLEPNALMGQTSGIIGRMTCGLCKTTH
ncbi:MAG: hypothetical protein ACJA1U_000613 [Bermanella sp.]|jgi:hypothetical protein